MLRAVISSSRGALRGPLRSTSSSQWHSARAFGSSQRRFAPNDGKRADQTVLPGSESRLANDDIPQPPVIASNSRIGQPLASSPEIVVTSAAPDSTIPVVAEGNIPLAPPSPEEVGANAPRTTTTTTSNTIPPVESPPPAAALPPPRKRRSWGRRFFWLSVLLGFGYAGSVYYALVSDNFHDFFTEYVPFGESAVSYFEEREFKRRFPNGKSSRMYPQISGENKVQILGKSGVSARISEEPSGSDLSAKGGSHASAVVPKAPNVPSSSSKPTAPKSEVPPPGAQVGPKTSASGPGVTTRSGEPAKATESITAASKPAPAPTSAAPSGTSASPAGPVFAPIPLLDHMNIENAADPIVQEITKMLNDLITVVNADKAQDKYAAALQKAKDDVQKAAKDMAAFRTAEAQAAEKKILDSQLQFDEGARELLKRIKQEQEDQELQWRKEYEAERERLAETYESKLKADIEAAQRVAEQNQRNALLEQEIKLKEFFATQVRDRVETERSGRLSKLTELSSSVAELEQLTTKWNEVVDSNLKTQHLNVAVDAVKSVLDSADRPKPFLHELVALKEIASDDPVVNAAIASINPAAYQRGVPTIAQLVDRFRRVAGEVRKAALLPEDAGAASHAASFLLSKVMFKKSGLSEGSDVESVLTRAETFLEEGELDEATREVNGLQGWAKVLSRDWLAEARRVLEVKQALDVIATEARLQSLMVE